MATARATRTRAEAIRLSRRPSSSPTTKLEVAGPIKATYGVYSMATNEGAQLNLVNPLKTGPNASTWTLFNMTGGYGNSLQFYSYPADGVGYNGGCCVPRFIIKDT